MHMRLTLSARRTSSWLLGLTWIIAIVAAVAPPAARAALFTATPKSVPVGSGPVVAIGDLDGDGIPDVGTMNADNTLTRLINDGSGALPPTAQLDIVSGNSFALGDVNGD